MTRSCSRWVLACTRFEHALTIDDVLLDELLHGLIQDVEGGYVHVSRSSLPGGSDGRCRYTSSR